MLQAILLCFILNTIQAVGGTIKGSVFDLMYREPVPGDLVQLLDTETRTVLLSAVTDRNGDFKFENVKSGHYFINTSMDGFSDQPAAASVQEKKTADIGKLYLRVHSFTDSHFTHRGVQVYKPDGKPLMKETIPPPIDVHLKSLHGIPIMTVCDYLELRNSKPIYYMDPGAIVIGILEQTEQGSWLKQTCNDSLRTGDYIWPNAIMLHELEERGPPYIRKDLWDNEYIPQLVNPFFIERELSDSEAQWVAVFGGLKTREVLIAAPCEVKPLCGFGFGPVSAPAQLNYRYIYYFDNPQK
jgi:hypothetical protein